MEWKEKQRVQEALEACQAREEKEVASWRKREGYLVVSTNEVEERILLLKAQPDKERKRNLLVYKLKTWNHKCLS